MRTEELIWDLDLSEQAETRWRCDAALAPGIRASFSCSPLFARAAAREELVKVIAFLHHREQSP